MASAFWPRVAVVGAGAVGGYFGGMLARAGAQVTLIGRPAHVKVWTRDGLFIDGVNFQEHIPIAASTELAAASEAELVLFSVKTLDTDATALQLAHYLRKDTLLVSFQNGIGNVERIREVSSLDPIAAVVYVASSMPAPGRIKHSGRGELVIGDVAGRSGPPRELAIARIAGWFEAAGVPCQVSANIEGDLWTKLIANVALNAISAVVNVPYGAIVAIPEAREMVRQLVGECVAVARAGGVRLHDVDFVDMVLRFAEKAGQVYSSTSQDLNRGKRTEVESFNGFVVRRGAELGVPTPVNQSLLALIKLRETQLST